MIYSKLKKKRKKTHNDKSMPSSIWQPMVCNGMCYHLADLGRGSHVESGSAWCQAGIIERFEKFKMAAKKTIKIENDIEMSFLCQIFIVIHNFSCFRRQRIYQTNYKCILSNISWHYRSMDGNLFIRTKPSTLFPYPWTLCPYHLRWWLLCCSFCT